MKSGVLCRGVMLEILLDVDTWHLLWFSSLAYHVTVGLVAPSVHIASDVCGLAVSTSTVHESNINYETCKAWSRYNGYPFESRPVRQITNSCNIL